MLMGVESSQGMDCLQLRQSAPFHYLISEQAKSLVALQELQHEVGALLEFRDLVIETFPNLRSKMASSTPTTMINSSNIPVAIKRDWEPGVRVRRKLNSKEERAKKTESTIQDSGFSTETSSKETHSSSSAMTAAMNVESEDELWNLLDVIHRKGTRLKNEVEALQGALQNNLPQEEPNFQRTLFHASSADDIRQLKRERDLLLDRVAEMEAEVLAGRIHTSRLQEDLENLLATKHDLEAQLKAVVSQRGEINSRIRDMHLEFVAQSPEKSEKRVSRKDGASQRTKVILKGFEGVDEGGDGDKEVVGDLPRVLVPDRRKFEAILMENDPLILQKCLLTTTVENQVLQSKLESAVKKEEGLTDELALTREENEDLKFQLEDKNIELEGTKARVRVLEQLQKPSSTTSSSAPSPDVIPASESSPNSNSNLIERDRLRSEITTASMKAMSPYPLTLQLDHSSSTESAHDQAAETKKKTKPSKIPLKSYAAPKPPLNHSNNSGNVSTGSNSCKNSYKSSNHHHHSSSSRSRSGDSLNRSHHSSNGHSWKNNSCNKSGDSFGGSFGSTRGTLRKNSTVSGSSGHGLGGSSSTTTSSTSVRRSGSARESPDQAKVLNSPKGKFHYQWILSSFNSPRNPYLNFPDFPDSLNDTISSSKFHQDRENRRFFESSHNSIVFDDYRSTSFELDGRFYDSIDSSSSFCQQTGETLAETETETVVVDSLESSLEKGRLFFHSDGALNGKK